MGRIGLQLRATLENITRLRAEGEDFRWYLKLKCGNCGEVSEKWQYLRLMDSAPLKGGRGSATMVQKCKLCSRENSIELSPGIQGISSLVHWCLSSQQTHSGHQFRETARPPGESRLLHEQNSSVLLFYKSM
ncbi:CXXC motif containing zinc binding protein isoform X2 [Catharus ustulatus]|uniref:CXXC motif containing zinc binding protein isoform X2 n=1 Tax=Catharus ustulatus TaxID=91951 RepID=UPI00140CB461|nr:CXXC motif containing zinc binding protein isoform X2 [Catharus ustulatus]